LVLAIEFVPSLLLFEVQPVGRGHEFNNTLVVRVSAHGFTLYAGGNFALLLDSLNHTRQSLKLKMSTLLQNPQEAKH
jgi:hypothetical protein